MSDTPEASPPCDNDPCDNDPCDNDPSGDDNSCDGNPRASNPPANSVDGSINRHKRRHHRRRHRARRTGKALVATVACLVFLITAAGWASTQWLDGQLREVLALDPNSAAITDAQAQRGDENVLLVGSDSRAGDQQEAQFGNAEMVPGARSDTVMVAHLPADRSRAVIVSFPRDLQIQRPPCQVWDPVSRSYTGLTDPGADIAKLNTAYQVGGPLCVTKVVQHLSGLAITRFVGVDFQGFQSMVDAVGGVRICVERPLEDDRLGMIIPKPGYSTISGNTALNYVRARHVVGDPTSDYGRIARQQHFLSALLNEVLSPGVLLNPAKVSALITAVAANTVGENIDSSALLSLAHSVEDLDPANVTFVTVPTTGSANEYGNEELRAQDTAALFRAIIDGTPLPVRRPPSTPAPGVAEPGFDGDKPETAAEVPPVAPRPLATKRATAPLATVRGPDTVCS